MTTDKLVHDVREAFEEYRQKMNALAEAELLVSAHWDNVALLYDRAADLFEEEADWWKKVGDEA